MYLPLWRRLRAAVGSRRDLLRQRDVLADRVIELENYCAELMAGELADL